MNIGFVGLGKLGYPVACAMNSRGVTIRGYDPLRTSHDDELWGEKGRLKEDTFKNWRDKNVNFSNFHFSNLEMIVEMSEIIFVAVQTPHDEQFDGTHALTSARSDFDYTFLEAVLKDIFDITTEKKVISVISTCLPGTMRRLVNRFGGKLDIVYNPYFIAMGTVIWDFFHPEFILVGGGSADSHEVLKNFYMDEMRLDYPYFMSLESAELAKVAYNTFIGMKIAVINTLMEICHKVPGADIDEVSGVLKLADKRILGPTYMDGGMGDGGPCHPRDNIAMSWLAQELELSFDIFGTIMKCRERQTQWIGDIVRGFAGEDLEIYILGSAYKPETDLTDGSSAILLMGLLAEKTPVMVNPPYARNLTPKEKAVYIIGCKHEEFQDYTFAKGSIVIDPFRYIPNQLDVKVIRIGEA